jgi:hypothetical protein
LTSISAIVQKESNEYEKEYNNRFEKGHLLNKKVTRTEKRKERKPGKNTPIPILLLVSKNHAINRQKQETNDAPFPPKSRTRNKTRKPSLDARKQK